MLTWFKLFRKRVRIAVIKQLCGVTDLGVFSPCISEVDKITLCINIGVSLSKTFNEFINLI